MPLVLTETPVRPTPLDPPRKRWTRAECSALEATGAFDTTRLELVEGELISRWESTGHMSVSLTASSSP